MVFEQPKDPFFRPVIADRFERDAIADLASGRCAAIQVHDFLSQETCAEILAALTSVEFETYGQPRVQPAVMRYGAGVSDYRRGGVVTDDFWQAVDRSNNAWASLGLEYDPFRLCREGIAQGWPGGVHIGRRDGREMTPGVAREPNQGFQVHYDDALREFAGNLLDANLVAQFAFNLYVSVPESGGETVVWRHRWDPADEAHRLPNSYGYAQSVIGGDESFELKPHIGEALLFNPRNFHAVRPSHDARRIALGFSVGMSDTGQLFTWG